MYIRFLTLIQSPMWVGLNHVDFEGSWSEQGNIDQLMKVTQELGDRDCTEHAAPLHVVQVLSALLPRRPSFARAV